MQVIGVLHTFRVVSHTYNDVAVYCSAGVTTLSNGDYWKSVASTDCATGSSTSGKLPANSGKLPANISLGNGINFSMSAILSDLSSRVKVDGKSCTQDDDNSSYNTPHHIQSSWGLHQYVSDTNLSDPLRPVGKTSKTPSDSFNSVGKMKSTARSPLFDISKSLETENGGAVMRRHSVPKVRDVSVAVTNTGTSSTGKKRRATSNKSEFCLVTVTVDFLVHAAQ